MAHWKYVIGVTIIVITVQINFLTGTVILAFSRPLFGGFFPVGSSVSIELKENAKLYPSIRLSLGKVLK